MSIIHLQSIAKWRAGTITNHKADIRWIPQQKSHTYYNWLNNTYILNFHSTHLLTYVYTYLPTFSFIYLLFMFLLLYVCIYFLFSITHSLTHSFSYLIIHPLTHIQGLNILLNASCSSPVRSLQLADHTGHLSLSHNPTVLPTTRR